MLAINIPEERILSACDQAISHLNDLIVLNMDLHDRGKDIRLGEKGVKTGKEIARECEAKRAKFYQIKHKIGDDWELTENDFNLIKSYL